MSQGILTQTFSFSAPMASASPFARGTRGNPRHPFLFALSIIMAPALWVAFVGTGNTHELIVGAVCSLATVLFISFVSRSCSDELAFRPHDVVQLWRVPWYIVSGVFQVTLVAFKDALRISNAKSLYRVCGFETSTHDPIRKARTILAVAYTTAGPSFIVLGVDPAQSRMLFHQIESTAVPKMTKSLGAKP